VNMVVYFGGSTIVLFVGQLNLKIIYKIHTYRPEPQDVAAT
jgi:hypothetical protein